MFNDSYSRDISIKVRSQIDVRQRKGDYIGSFPIFGYFRDKEHKGQLIVDETAAVVRDIFAMKVAGKNHKRIADYLNEHGVPSPMEYKALLKWRYSTSFKLNPKAKWSPVAVERILKNEIYTGTMVQGREKTLNYKVKKRIKVAKKDWIRVEDTHEPIVSKEDFALVQKLLLCDTRTSPREQEVYLFAGLLYCGDCNETMVQKKQRTGGKEYIYYVCSGNKKDKTVCSSHRIKEDDLKEMVLKMLRIHVFLVCSLESLLKAMKELPLHEYTIGGTAKWIGLDNYIRLFTKDREFWNSLKVTLIYTFVTVPFKVFLALMIAIFLNRDIKGINLIRTLYYIPSLFGGNVAISILWKLMFLEKGVVNSWLGNTKTALFVICFLEIWMFGSSMVMFLAALKQVPRSLCEAAELDGAGKVQVFFHVTLPQITPILFFTLVNQLVQAVQNYTSAAVVTNGGPLKSTFVLGMKLYQEGFSYFNMGYASALAWGVFTIIVILTLALFKSSSAWVFYGDEGEF